MLILMKKIDRLFPETVFSRIVATTISKQAWAFCKTKSQGSSKVITVKPQNLRNEFETLLMKEK